jgi:hypothetical protein
LACPTGNSRIRLMRKLPVVPICRRRARLRRRANHDHPLAHPASSKRGVRVVSIRGVRAAVDADSVARERDRSAALTVSDRFPRRTSGDVAYGKTVWSWHPLLVLSFAEARVPNRVQLSLPIREATEARRIRLRGARHTPSNHCAGKAGLHPASPVVFLLCILALPGAQGATGASRHPVFPAPSHDCRGSKTMDKLGRDGAARR